MLDMRREPHRVDRRNEPATAIGIDADRSLQRADQLAARVAMPLRAPPVDLLASRDQYHWPCGIEAGRIDKGNGHGVQAVLNGLDTLAAHAAGRLDAGRSDE